MVVVAERSGCGAVYAILNAVDFAVNVSNEHARLLLSERVQVVDVFDLTDELHVENDDYSERYGDEKFDEPFDSEKTRPHLC
jgi:hypothetical protein